MSHNFSFPPYNIYMNMFFFCYKKIESKYSVFTIDIFIKRNIYAYVNKSDTANNKFYDVNLAKFLSVKKILFDV